MCWKEVKCRNVDGSTWDLQIEMVTEAFPVFMSLVRKENGLIYAEPEFRINGLRAINIAGKDYFDKKKSYIRIWWSCCYCKFKGKRQMKLQQCVCLDRSIQRIMRVCRLGKKRSQRIFARNEDVAQGRAPSTVAAVHKTRSCLQLVHVQGTQGLQALQLVIYVGQCCIGQVLT